MFEFNINSDRYSKIHFIGIGGISMSGLAEILLTEGYTVTGSDSNYTKVVERLEKLGAKVYINHSEDNINNADLVIYTDAISLDNKELLKAQALDIPVIDRATFLGALMKNYENSIAISGTHGKTTTTSMLSTIFNRSVLNPTILLGGQLKEIGGNVRLGSKEYMLTEACEYKGNILKYFPTMAVILNMDEDHLDYFKDMDHIINTFVNYGKNLASDSYLLINIDDNNAQKVIDSTPAKVITFGIDKDADYKVENIKFSPEGLSSFELKVNNQEFYEFSLNVMGIHNIYNSLGAIAAAHIIGLSMEEIQANIIHYTGVQRRLEVKGFYNEVKIIDDYAHHPTEIKATLSAIRNSTKGEIYCVFQPHTFTRTQILLKSFAKSFTDANTVIITDIYAARERDNGVIHSRDLARAITSTNSIYLETFDEISSYLIDNIKDDDVVVTMGAGNIYLVGEAVLESSKKKEKTAV